VGVASYGPPEPLNQENDVRFIVDIEHRRGVVEGQVTQEGVTGPHPFSGWLDLLRLLEPSVAPTADLTPTGPVVTDGGSVHE
jgi:hypothetical protein